MLLSTLSTAPDAAMKPSPRSSPAKPSPATAMKSPIRSSTTKKLSTLVTTPMKPSSRRCIIPHISRNEFSPGRSSVGAEIAAPKLSQDYEYEFDDLDVLEENVPCLSEKAESWLQMPVHKMSSEGMNTMVVEGESDTDGNQIGDSTKEELSVAAMYDRLNVLEEVDPELQKPLPKKPSEDMANMAVQDEARTHKNYKLFKLFDSFAKSEHHNPYSTEVSPPRDRGYLLFDFYDYDYDFEDDVSKPVNEGESGTDGNQIVDSTKEELSVAAMYDHLNVLEEDDPELQKPLPKKPSEDMTKMAVQDEARTHKNYKLFKLFDSFAKSEHHNPYSTEVSPPRDRGYLLYDFFGYDYDFEDDVSKPVNEGENSTPPR